MINSFRGSNKWLSNFWPCEVVIDGIAYPTTEHAYQAQKSLLESERRRIAALPTPLEAMREGRKMEQRPDWEQVKLSFMRAVTRTKFAFGTELAERLKATGDQHLEEGNWWHDNFWGVCECRTCGGKGENWLGRILMELREDLQRYGR